MRINQQRISQITNNTNFSEIGNLLSQGHDMDYIARHYHMDLALVWALRLEGKTDQEKFSELGWGLRTWDQWNFNECLPREIHVNDSKAYLTGVMNDLETTGLPATCPLVPYNARRVSLAQRRQSATLKAFAQARRAGRGGYRLN